jgi:hypothetical protein
MTNKDNNLQVGVGIDSKSLSDLSKNLDKALNLLKNFSKNVSKIFDPTSFDKQGYNAKGNRIANYSEMKRRSRATGTALSARNAVLDEPIIVSEKTNEILDATGKKIMEVSTIVSKQLGATGKGRNKLSRELETVVTTTKDLRDNTVQTRKVVYDNYQVMTNSGTAWSRNTVETNQEAAKSQKKFIDALGETAIVAIAVWRRLSRTMSKFLSNIITQGASLTELEGRFDRIMGSMADKAEEMADKIQAAYGLNEVELKNNILELYNLAKNANLSSDSALELAKNMTVLGAELASVWDTDIEQATNALVSGLQGLPKSLKKYSVFVGTEEAKEYLKQVGILAEDYTGTLTRQQKTMAVYLKTLEDAGYALGDFNATSGSMANQQRILQNTLLTTYQQLGAMVNTVLSPLVRVLNTILKAVNSVISKINEWHPVFKGFVGLLILGVTVVPIAAGAIIYLGYAYKKLQKSISETLPSLDKFLTKNKKLIADIYGAASGLLLLITAVTMAFNYFSSAAKNTEDATDAMESYDKATKNATRTLSSFDDVNVFKEGNSGILGEDWSSYEDMLDSLGESVDDILEDTNGISKALDDMYPLIIGIVAAIGAIKLLQTFGVFTKLAEMLGEKNLLGKSVMSFGAKLAAVLGVILAIVAVVYSLVDLISKVANGTATFVDYLGFVLVLLGAIATIWGILAKRPLLTIAGVAGMGLGLGLQVANTGVPSSSSGSGDDSLNMTRGASTNIVSMNDVGGNLSTPAGTSGNVMSSSRGGANPINITVNVDEDYIYRSYNKQSKLRGV